MNTAALADELRGLAARVRALTVRRRDPEHFHVEKSELGHLLARLADEVELPGGRFSEVGTSRAPEVEVKSRRGNIEVIQVGGRRVMVQEKRRSFAISAR